MIFRWLWAIHPLAAIGVMTIAVTAVIGAYAYWHSSVYNKGYNAAIAAIAAQDKEAVDAADKARARVRECIISNGVWDASRGICKR